MCERRGRRDPAPPFSQREGLRWSDVDLDGAKLHVRQTRVAYGKLHVTKEPKTARSRRQIPLSPVAIEALRAHGTRQKRGKLAAGPTYADVGLVFADEIGDPLDPPAVSAAFGTLVREAWLPRITLHGVRHSFAPSRSRPASTCST